MIVKYAQEQRLRLIDFLLASYGDVGRAELMDFFDVGPACATRDFRLYCEQAPENCILDRSTKRYLRSKQFKRAYNP